MKELTLQPAYVLHTRPYRDTSLLIDSLTRDYGRVSWVARGVRRAKSKNAGLLQPFIPLYLSGKGRGELLALYRVEAAAAAQVLLGKGLFCGFYLNELCVRLLAQFDSSPALFSYYSQTITALAGKESCTQSILRTFEWHMLRELGYAPQLEQTHDTHQPILADKHYFFEPHQGLSIAIQYKQRRTFSGKNLLAIAQGDFTQEIFKEDAKYLFRMAIQSLLGNKTLCSRKLFYAD